MPPTVLDGEHSSAFCPPPEGHLKGFAVDLSCNTPPVCCEVLHPRIPLSAENVWRVGEITRPVTEDELRNARHWHLEWVREETGIDDYASHTDADLLGP